MTSLVGYDPLQLKCVTKEQITAAKEAAENVVVVNGKPFQYDADSRARISSVLASMDYDDTVSWRTKDNESVEFTNEEFALFSAEAKRAHGLKVRSVFERANELKGRLEAGIKVTERELLIGAWQ